MTMNRDRSALEESEFWTKLWSMNWVEKMHARDKAIAEQSDGIMAAVEGSIRDSVHTFNRLYHDSRERIKIEAAPQRLTLSARLSGSGKNSIEDIKSATATLPFNPRNYVISATFTNVSAMPVTLKMDVSEDLKEVFLIQQTEDGWARIKDADEAAELLLRAFLENLKNS